MHPRRGACWLQPCQCRAIGNDLCSLQGWCQPQRAGARDPSRLHRRRQRADAYRARARRGGFLANGEIGVRGVFVDANEALAVIFERLAKPDDPEIRIHRDPDVTPDQLPRVLDGAGIAVVDHTALPTEIARKCAGLKHVVFLGTGARSYMNPEELDQLGIAVHLIRGYGDTAVAESAIALMWAAARGIARMNREMRAGNWLREDGMQLSGKTLGLIGFGGIAAEVARIALGSGMRVLAWNRTPKSFAGVSRDRQAARAKRCRLAASAVERGDPRLSLTPTYRGDEARRDPRQHRARRAGGRSRHDRRAEFRPHPPRRAGRFQHRAAADRSSADQAAKRDALGAVGIPHSRRE